MSRIPMTAVGGETIKAELEQLKRVDRPAVIEAIAEARAHGDLKENAEYHAAKEKQGFLEARIRELEAQVSHMQIIDISQMENTGKVIFGATVKLTDVNTEESVQYQLVGNYEADLKQGKISISSPIARAIIGKEEGEEVDVETPRGVVTYEIDEVLYI